MRCLVQSRREFRLEHPQRAHASHHENQLRVRAVPAGAWPLWPLPCAAGRAGGVQRVNELAGAAGGGHIGGPGRGKAALGGGCTGPRSRGVRARGCSAGLLEPGPTPSASPTASGSGWAMGGLLWCPPGSPQATRQPLNSASVPPSLELGVRHLEAESCPSQAWTCGPAEGAGHWELGLGEQEERPASSAARLGARGRGGRHVGGSLHARTLCSHDRCQRLGDPGCTARVRPSALEQAESPSHRL